MIPDSPDLLRFINPGQIPFAVIVVAAAVIVVRVLNRLFDQAGDAFTSRRMFFKKAATFTRFGVYVAAVVAALSAVLRLNSEAVLALSGTIAVTLGFAFKDLAASALAGFTILFDSPFQVGDRIAFGGYYGEVKEIGLRSVRLVTLDDNLVTIPSNKFLTDAVASANAGALDAMVVIPFYVDADADYDRARAIVGEAVLASKYVYLDKPVVVLLAHKLVGPHVVIEITAKAYVYDVRHEKAFASDVTDMVLRALRQESIDVPRLRLEPDAPAA